MTGLAAGASYPHDQALTIRRRSPRPSHSDEVQTVINPRQDRFWLLAALLFGLLLLPFLVHVTGVYVLGPYADGGAAAFFGSYLSGLVTLRWYSWVLALGPLVIVASWGILGRWASSSRG
jgi:hypothetical protein